MGGVSTTPPLSNPPPPLRDLEGGGISSIWEKGGGMGGAPNDWVRGISAGNEGAWIANIVFPPILSFEKLHFEVFVARNLGCSHMFVGKSIKGQ